MKNGNGITPDPEIIDAGVIEKMTKAERDSQIDIARRYPRTVSLFHERAVALATHSEEIAASCFYALRRGGNVIEGPSIRLAEIVASTWGNLRCESRVIDEGRHFITAEGSAWDLETNYAVRREVRRRITTRDGKRYGDDMILVTGNAAAAIAYRNAVFNVVPSAYVNTILAEARMVAIGDVETLGAKRVKWIALFAKGGIEQDRILASLGRRRIEDVTLEDLALMQATFTAIKEGSLSPDDAFEIAEESPPAPEPGHRSFGPKGRRAEATPGEVAAELAKPPPPAPPDPGPGRPPATGAGAAVADRVASVDTEHKEGLDKREAAIKAAMATYSLPAADAKWRMRLCDTLPEIETVIIGEKRKTVLIQYESRKAELEQAEKARQARLPGLDEPPPSFDHNEPPPLGDQDRPR